MDAMEKGHANVAKKLILAGVNVTMQTVGGNTALHIAAFCNNIQCGILLAEEGASVRTKNNLAQTPLDLAKSEFKEATKKTLSFTTRKALCIIGNAEGGKKLTRCMEATRDLKELPLEFVGSNFLNCRQPQSTGIDHISKFIQAIPIPEFRATHTRYSFAWVLSQICRSSMAQAVQLKEFSILYMHDELL